MTAQVDVQFAAADESIPDSAEITGWVSRTLESAGRASEEEVSVRIVGEAEMQQLNKAFREQDKTTNVLSFPSGEIEGLPADAGQPLGDIVVCAAVVASEARDQGKSSADHWAHMMVHGTLHLLGFDHENDLDAEEMESLETKILATLGIANPYTEARHTGDEN